MSKNIGYRDVGRFALHYCKRRPRAGLLCIGLMFAATAIDVLVPVYTGKIIDALVGHYPGDTQALHSALYYLLVFAVIAIMFNVLRYSAIHVWNWFSLRNLHDVLNEAMQKVQRFSADWHANAFAGATVRKITRGMWSFDMFCDTLFIGLLPAFVIMFGVTGMLLYKLPLVGLFTALMVLLYCIVSISIAVKILSPRFREAAATDTKVGAVLADVMTGVPTIKAFGAERREDAAFGKVATYWHKMTERAWQTAALGDLVRGLLRTIMLVGMVGVTVWMWQSGTATPGDIALSLTSSFLIGGYLRDIGMHISHLQKAISEMEDIIIFWRRDDEVRDVDGAGALAVSDGRIDFDRVHFAYNGNENPIYDDLSVTINAGEKVALVGFSGSGKSTFVKLVQRLYDIQGGAISIDGQNIAHVTQESLRRHIALVPQEPILFHRSLAENIAYGKPGAGMDDIVTAAKQAYAHDFIMSLSQGYDTLVGERGAKLSGGERQRVAIARAILADAPILILDEATSALDSVSEHYIQRALETLMDGKTTITIAHRLATIRQADRILVFDQGRIVEQGRHDELVVCETSRYRQLYEMQALDLAGGYHNENREAAE